MLPVHALIQKLHFLLNLHLNSVKVTFCENDVIVYIVYIVYKCQREKQT